jgi:ribosome-binding protein aMBF1 (putative translation factor)
MMARRKTRDAREIVDRMIGDDEELRAAVDEETVHSHVASLLYEARTRAGLTQSDLAELVGTRQSVISRLESADYGGHSLSMLVRIAAALEKRIEIRFVPRQSAKKRA